MASRLKHHPELILPALRAVRCFSSWPQDVLARMQAAAELWLYGKGDSVAERGDPPKGLWIIATGSLTSHRSTPNGKYYLQGVLWPGHMIGVMPIIDGIGMPLSHAARRDSLVAFVPRAAVLEALDDTRRLHDVTTLLCQRSRGDYEGMFAINAESLSCRLAKLLSYLPRRSVFTSVGEPGSPTWTDPAPIDLTQEEIASMVGVSRQTLNRALQPFLHQGIVAYDGDTIRVVSFRRLIPFMEENEPLPEIWRNEVLSWDERIRRSDPGIAKLETAPLDARP